MEFLEMLRNCKQEWIGIERADELEADGQLVFGEAAGNRNGGDACQIGGAVQPKQQGTSRTRSAVDGDRLFIDQRSCDGGCWNKQSVQVIFQERGMEFRDEPFAHLHRFQIGDGADFRAHFQSSAYILSILVFTSREPSCLLMIEQCLSPSDLVSGLFRFQGEGERNIF